MMVKIFTLALLSVALFLNGGVVHAQTHITAPYQTDVDHSSSTNALINASVFQSVDTKIANHVFESEGSFRTSIEIVLISFADSRTGEEQIAEMDRLGYRPATLRELLSFDLQYTLNHTLHPEGQEEFNIFALGTVWKASQKSDAPKLVASLNHRRTKYLSAVSLDEHFCGPTVWFAAVRK